ncbi:M57 family metalloprotease [Pedobacter sp. NJ-S-72]
MKNNILLNPKTISIALLMTVAVVISCKKSNNDVPPAGQNSTSELSKGEQDAIAHAGFSPTNAFKTQGGYIVEGDIFLTPNDLQVQKVFVAGLSGNGPKTEQYKTVYKVTLDTIKLKVSAGTAQSVFTKATTEAVKRYNALGLKVIFTLLDSSSVVKEDILIAGQKFDDPRILGQSAGFPSADGKPATPIKLSNTVYDKDYKDNNLLATVVAHEIGHAIGFRHTDYADRRYSCGYQSFLDYFRAANEGDGGAGIGAIHIPGTPEGGEPGSWMLACSDGTNRPFTNSDIIAIKDLYPVK